MRIKDQFKVRKVGNEEVIVSNDSSGLNFSRVIVLNPTAYFLLKETGHNPFDTDQWSNLLVKEYGIDHQRARLDVEKLIEKLTRENIIE